MTKVFTVAEMALREALRRRAVLAILLLLPLAFYFSRRSDHPGQSIRFVCLGAGWALSTAALFAGSAGRAIDPRLRLSGYLPRHLYLGRLAALWTIGLLVSVPYFLQRLSGPRGTARGGRHARPHRAGLRGLGHPAPSTAASAVHRTALKSAAPARGAAASRPWSRRARPRSARLRRSGRPRAAESPQGASPFELAP